MSNPSFVFATCQVGAEQVCKQTLLDGNTGARLAFSRPGCLTFKTEASAEPILQQLQRNPFARTWGHSLGVIQATEANELVNRCWELIGDRPVDRLHVWERDRTAPKSRRLEPTLSPLANSLGETLRAAGPEGLLLNRVAGKEQLVADCVILEPHEWLIGWHLATTHVGCWPGGLPPFHPRQEAPSRAYLKTLEALAWSKLPIRSGDVAAEIGSAPGGSSLALLEKGLTVIGIDPADMHEEVTSHPQFEHWRMRGHEVKRRSLSSVRWLFVDSNVAPQHTLDTVRELTEHSATHFKGLVLTLKLPEWKLAEDLPSYLEQVRSWGFRHVKLRQLVHNRQEVCLVALRNKALLRVGR